MRRGTPKFRLVSCEAAVQGVRTRLPVRHGHGYLNAVPLLFVKAEIESAGRRRSTGYSSDCLPLGWFGREASEDFRQSVEQELRAYRMAREIYLRNGASTTTASDLWHAAYPCVVEEGSRLGIGASIASFASSFLERAVVDAICRLRGVSFFEALRQDLLGLQTSKDLPVTPVEAFICRHTVGLSDPITVGEISEGDRLEDSLPQALEEHIESYGLYYFKVMLSGEADRDVERLARMAVLFDQRCRRGYRVTLDGNERYRDASGMEGLIEAVRSRPYGDQFLDSVLYLEQPFRREIGLDPSIAGEVTRLSQFRPIAVDECDDLPDSFERAVKLGYQGAAHRSSKGIFRSLKSRALVMRLNDEAAETRYFQTGEDVASVPIVTLQEDLASLAVLAISHCERNGHHYFHGLDHLPQAEVAQALAAHPDLYTVRGESAFLRIEDGLIQAKSIQAPGYGYSCEIAFGERTPLESWSFDQLGMK